MSARIPLQRNLRLALIQLLTGPSKSSNLSSARAHVLSAARPPHSAQLVILPECFNSPYGTQHFRRYAEPISSESESVSALAAMARDASVWLVGGSIPEIDPATDKLYNTSLVFDPQGEIVAKHRKLHLFDIDIPGKITFKESETLSPGEDAVTTFEMDGWGTVGLGICYDVRFPEMAMVAARREGVFLMVYPGAFNTTTGPMHWELLARARAVDNQIWVAMCSPARGEEGYQAWGHSVVVDPEAKVLKEAGEGEEMLVVEVEKEVIDRAREGIPVTRQRRFDVYSDVSKEG